MRLGQPIEAARTLDALAEVLLVAGRDADAVETLQRALVLEERVGRRRQYQRALRALRMSRETVRPTKRWAAPSGSSTRRQPPWRPDTRPHVSTREGRRRAGAADGDGSSESARGTRLEPPDELPAADVAARRRPTSPSGAVVVEPPEPVGGAAPSPSPGRSPSSRRAAGAAGPAGSAERRRGVRRRGHRRTRRSATATPRSRRVPGRGADLSRRGPARRRPRRVSRCRPDRPGRRGRPPALRGDLPGARLARPGHRADREPPAARRPRRRRRGREPGSARRSPPSTSRTNALPRLCV